MRFRPIACSILLAAGVGAPACVSPPSPETEDSTGVVLSLDARTLASFVPARVNQVLFAKLDPDDEPLLGYSVFASNHSDDGYYYLLNPPPGRYVAVAGVTASDPQLGKTPAWAGWQTDRDGNTTYVEPGPFQTGSFEVAIFFDEAMVRQTEITTRSGTVSFAGEYRVETSMLRDPDRVQSHYFELLKPGQSRSVVVQTLLHSAGIYDGEATVVGRDADARRRFLSAAHEHLAEVGWAGMLTRSAEEPEP